MIDTRDLNRRLATLRENRDTAKAVHKAWCLVEAVTPSALWLRVAYRITSAIHEMNAVERAIVTELAYVDAIVRAGSVSRSN